ncbi:MAG: hypothetical protein AB2A00_36730, partial [Myxococcota bacterium]
ESATHALLELSRDASGAPEIIFGAVLGAVMVEPEAAQRNTAAILRHGGAASAGVSTLLALTAAVGGLKVMPLTWLAGLQHGEDLLKMADAVTAVKGRHLTRPVADLCWKWSDDEVAFRAERAEARRSMPPPARKEQLALFMGDENSRNKT